MGNTSKKVFKKSAFGGFNREDVANYIATLSEEHTAEVNEVHEELKKSATENVELKNKLSELEAECRALREKLNDYEEISEALAETKAELDALLAENKEIKSQLQSATDELTVLQKREQEVKSNKERIADLELEARRRVAEAEETARAKMQTEAEQHRAAMEAQTAEVNAYRDEKYAEVARNIGEIASAYQATKAAVATFKTGFKSVVSDLAREIDTLSDASLEVEQALTELSEVSKAKTE